jgi:hypothetical protein
MRLRPWNRSEVELALQTERAVTSHPPLREVGNSPLKLPWAQGLSLPRETDRGQREFVAFLTETHQTGRIKTKCRCMMVTHCTSGYWSAVSLPVEI